MSEANDSLSADSLAFLADAKKGKPRRFVMITKGSSIVSLVVYKKGSLEKYKKEAKESGKGIICFGVVDGSGQNISFKLCVSDGFQDGPVKNSVLKGFLNEAGFPCKPTFEIVQTLPEVPEDDEASTQPASTQPASPAPATSSSDDEATQPDTDPRIAQITAAMTRLMPSVKLALSKQPSERDSIISALSSVKQHLQSGAVDQAREVVLSVGRRVKELLAIPGAGQSNDTTDPWPQLRQKVVEELKALAKIIAQTKDVDAAAAIIELKAVIANLSPNPTGVGVQDLQRYLSQDDVVADVCNFAFDFRTPLLDCLNRMATN